MDIKRSGHSPDLKQLVPDKNDRHHPSDAHLDEPASQDESGRFFTNCIRLPQDFLILGQVLKDIRRICRYLSILSTPYIEKKNIRRTANIYRERDFLHDIFKFIPADRKNLIKLIPFSPACDRWGVVPHGCVLLFRWVIFSFRNKAAGNDAYCGCLRELPICHIVKNQGAKPA